ncbi:MAG: hypothetical protein Q9183_006118 [Haloplaca sp. 2 TL-2023]
MPATAYVPDCKIRSRPGDSIFFTLPLELRVAVYRYLVVSPLSSSTYISMCRPLCVDGAMYKIGYFSKDAVIPLLLTCQQIHAEATKLLYGESVFMFHVSNLTSAPLVIFNLFPQRYLALMKQVYLRTQFFLPWPLIPLGKVDPSLANVKESKRRQIIATQIEFASVKMEGSKILAQTAVPWESGFSVNLETTYEMRSEDWLCHMDDDSEEAQFEE